MKKLSCGVLFFLLVFSAKAQQDPQFSLSFLKRMYNNPGYAGNTTENLFTATGVSRLELTGFEGAPVVTAVDVHGPITLFGISSGVGISLYNDIAGALRAPGFSLTYAYRHKILDGVIGIGVTAGMIASWYVSPEWRLPEGGSVTDNSLPTGETAGMSFDMDFGVYYQSPSWFGGVACKHLTAPKLGQDRVGSLPRTFYANLGYTYAFEEPELVIMPMLDVITDFGQTGFCFKAVGFYKKVYWAGLGYRWEQAVIGMLGLEIFEGLKVAYAYEFPVSKLSRFSSGTHEMLLSYSFSIAVPKGSQRYKSIRYL
ncbi:MAG: PorP/SprF family type IX secretion system membrane protein [Bacteroidales bacterium]|nr:PorP/SprF family type IX secretion system membrane protein [Bacteroidales bacterium]MCL2132932.1 PorP/SprF family type IX secretion system membrane protein [Bacteroidales bacterium]